MIQQSRPASLTVMGTTIATLLVAAALTITHTAAAGYAENCAAACERDCNWAGRFDRCMRRRIDDCPSRSAPAAKPEVPSPNTLRYHGSARRRAGSSYAELVEVLLRFLPEMFGGLFGTVLLILRAISWARRRRDRRRLSEEMSCLANELERSVADLRARAFRLRHDI